MAQQDDSDYIGIRSGRYRNDARAPGFVGGRISPATGNLELPSSNNTQQILDSGSRLASSTAPATESPLSGIDSADEIKVPSTGDQVKSMAREGAKGLGTYAGQEIGSRVGSGQTFGEATTNFGKDLGIVGGDGSGTGSVVGSGADATTVPGNAPATSSAAPTLGDSVGGRLQSGANIGGAAGAGLGRAAVGLLTGEDPGRAVKAGVGTAVGTYIGNAIVPGVGGFVGGLVGGAAGGRVICTELVRQGRMAPPMVRLDAEFTAKALTPLHMIGYLAWAQPYTKLMRRDDWIGRIATAVMYPIAASRMEEIRYIERQRLTPHWCGRIVRCVFEPFCWIVGAIAVIRQHNKKGLIDVSAASPGA